MAIARRHLQETSERPNPVAAVHSWRSPADSAVELILVTHLTVYSDIHEHAISALPNETGGFLLGRVGLDAERGSWHVEVDECMPVNPVEQTPAHFSFTWRDVDRVRNYREQQGKALIGWYHTHPDLGIFLSDTDLEKSHRVLFAEPFQVALVYDPVRGRAGYFFWEGRQMIDPSQAPWREFQITASAEDQHQIVDEAVQAGGPVDPSGGEVA
jgi:proteasome lid subunit RPN8/RPN11